MRPSVSDSSFSRDSWNGKSALAAVLAVGVATAVQAVLEYYDYFGEVFPWVTYCFAVFAAAWFGGLFPAAIALVLGYVIATLVFVTPGTLGVSGRDSLAAVAIYLAYGSFAGVITESLHRSRRIAQDAAHMAEDQRRRLQVTLQSIGEAVIVTDAEGRVVSLNPVAQDLTGWSDAEAADRPLSEVFPIVEEQSSTPAANPVNRVLREGRVVGLANHTALVRRDGSRIAIADSAAPIRDADQQISGVILIFRDVSEQRQAEVALRASEQELRAVNDTLEQRVAQRTESLERQTRQLRLLANELTEAEQRERKKLAKALHDGLQQMLVGMKMQLPLCSGPEGRRHLARIEEILDSTISASRSLSYELSPPILHDSGLPEALEWLVRWFGETEDLAVGLKVDPGLPFLPENTRVFLFQAIRELLQNVLRHAGVRDAEVEVAAIEDRVVVAVRDRGQGFDPEKVADETEQPRGFGLFSLRERVEALGGTLSIQSSAGAGAQLTLTLPVSPVEPILDEPLVGHVSQEGVDEMSQASTNNRIRILLADDHRIVREGLMVMLRGQTDFQVVGEAADGLEAVERAGALRPDVIVMDVSMPRLGGVEATRRIKEQHPEICVVGLSLHEAEDMAGAMGDAGASAYLRKDGPSHKLFATIRDLCGAEGE